MEEARYSINVRFNYRGYDSQITLRDDESCSELLSKFAAALDALEKKGATPARRWEDVKGNGYGNGHDKHGPYPCNGTGKTPSGSAQQLLVVSTKPICRHCGSDAHMELIDFERPEGVQRREWKCVTCQKWHYDKARK